MSMRIENSNVGGVAGSGSFGSVQQTGSESNSRSADDSSSDTVKLSSASSLIALAKNVNDAGRQSRVAELTSQVRSGSYQVAPQEVSQAMLRQLT